MASLQGQEIKDTYQALLKTDSNTTISSSLQAITDGQGNPTALSLSDTQLYVNGGLITGTTDNIVYSTFYDSTDVVTLPWRNLYIEMGSNSNFIDLYPIASQTPNTVTVSGDVSSVTIAPVTYFYGDGISLDGDIIDLYNYPGLYPYYYDDLQITNISYNAGTNQSTITFAGDFLPTYPTYYYSVSSSLANTYSLSNGIGAQAIGITSHAEGEGTKAIGYNSHAEGIYTTSIGLSSHAEGNSTTAIGESSHAEGFYTIAIGDRSHAEGTVTTAIGYASHAEGFLTTSVGAYSHAEGNYTKAIGRLNGGWSHAEGEQTTAIGNGSHAEGSYTTAIGWVSHAEGWGTISSGSWDGVTSGIVQHAEGRWNIVDTSSLLIVGNGTANNTRANAFAVTTWGTNNVSSSLVTPFISQSLNYTNDAAAAAGGVPLGGFYRSGSVVMIRVV